MRHAILVFGPILLILLLYIRADNIRWARKKREETKYWTN